MLLPTREETGIPADTATLGQKLLPPDNRYRVIGDRLNDVVRDEDFVELYSPGGRPAISPALLSLVTVFQFLEDIPDREAAENVVVRIDWKYALHLPLEDRGFHYSDLSNFRERLEKHGKERVYFDALLARLKALGFVKKRGRQRTDSTHILALVRQLSRLELVWETLRVTLRAIEKAAPTWYLEHLPESFRTMYTEEKSDFRLTDAEREKALRQAGADAFWLRDRLIESAPDVVRALAEVQTLEVVLAQHFERVEGQVQERKTPIDGQGTGIISSPHETEARHAKKRGKSWMGYKAHLTETAEDDQPNFITDVVTVLAPEGDIKALPQIRTNLREQDIPPAEQYVDRSYVSGKSLAESAAAEIKLMGEVQEDHAHPGIFSQADFQVDQAQKHAVCLAGRTQESWTRRRQRDGSWATVIRFGNRCTDCPLRAQCTTAKGGRSLTIHEYRDLLEARRAEAKTPEFQEAMKRRAPIEGTISQLVRRTGFRRSRYRGLRKTHLQNLFKAAAVNLERLVRALVGQKSSCQTAPVAS